VFGNDHAQTRRLAKSLLQHGWIRLVAGADGSAGNHGTRTRIGNPKRCRRTQVSAQTSDRIDGYMLMISYISPLATACCTVATPSLRLAFSV
jgi:hypothetical protein